MGDWISIKPVQKDEAGNRTRVLALCVIVGAIVFALDLAMPLGVAEAVPYVAAVLISLWSPQRRDTVITAAACTLLTVVGGFLSAPGAEAWMAVVNRFLAIFAIWGTALLALKIKLSDASVQANSRVLGGILRNMPAVVFRIDEHGYISQSVGKGLRRIGVQHFEVAGRTGLEPPPEVRGRVEHVSPGEAVFYESRGTHHGSQWWFLNCLTPDTTEGKGAIGFGLDITDRKRAERRLAALHAATTVLAGAESVAHGLPHLLRVVCEGLGWEIGAMWTIDHRRKVLRCAEVWYAPGTDLAGFEARTKEITFAQGVGLPGRVWASGEPAWITDVVEDPNFPRAADAEKGGLHAGFSFPILMGTELWGVMEFFSREIEEPDDDLLKMFTALGSQIGQFIERKQAERRLAAHHVVTAVLGETRSLTGSFPRILEAICESLGWEMGAMWTIDRQRDLLRCAEVWYAPGTDLAGFEARTKEITFAQGVGLPGRVWASGEPAWIADVMKDPNFPRAADAEKGGLHAGFSFPILMGTELWGVMEFFSLEIREPDANLLKMFEALGRQIGQFIQHKQAGAATRQSAVS